MSVFEGAKSGELHFSPVLWVAVGRVRVPIALLGGAGSLGC